MAHIKHDGGRWIELTGQTNYAGSGGANRGIIGSREPQVGDVVVTEASHAVFNEWGLDVARRGFSPLNVILRPITEDEREELRGIGWDV